MHSLVLQYWSFIALKSSIRCAFRQFQESLTVRHFYECSLVLSRQRDQEPKEIPSILVPTQLHFPRFIQQPMSTTAKGTRPKGELISSSYSNRLVFSRHPLSQGGTSPPYPSSFSKCSAWLSKQPSPQLWLRVRTLTSLLPKLLRKCSGMRLSQVSLAQLHNENKKLNVLNDGFQASGLWSLFDWLTLSVTAQSCGLVRSFAKACLRAVVHAAAPDFQALLNGTMWSIST